MKKNILTKETISIKEALKQLNASSERALLVTDKKDRLIGAITDGDIRRYLLKGNSLNDKIREVYNKNPVYIKKNNFSIDRAKKKFIKHKLDLLPILDENHHVIDFLIWSQVFSESEGFATKTEKIDVPLVIMAGGKGSRLEPFTKILPKALIPVGDKPIIEIIIDEFVKQGCKNHYLILNHKSEMVESYFNNIDKDYEITYLKENAFLGTASSLTLLKGKISDSFIVSNCDVIVKANYKEVIELHEQQSAYLTILSSIKHYKIPYGIIKFKDGGEVTETVEKPEYTFTVNAGVYVFNKKSLEFLPENSYFDMTDLIKSLIKNNKKVITYPVNENDYIDIGQWEEYKKAVDKLHQFS